MDTQDTKSSIHSAMRLKSYGCYKVPKINENHGDCQDAFDLCTERSRVAISDGATQSFYSGTWAEILCTSYCTWPSSIFLNQWVEWENAARTEWISQINKKLLDLKKEGKPSWIECLNGIKQKKEAFATFIGLTLEDSYIHGIAIGDSCALLVKIDGLDQRESDYYGETSIVRIFPGLWQHSFDTRTTCLSSYTSDSHFLPEFFDIPIPHDIDDHRILLMTDALADYTLTMERKGASVISKLLSISNQKEFEAYIAECRDTGLANDDTTLVVVGFSPKIDAISGVSHVQCNADQDSSIQEEIEGEENADVPSDAYLILNGAIEPISQSIPALPATIPHSIEASADVSGVDYQDDLRPSPHFSNTKGESYQAFQDNCQDLDNDTPSNNVSNDDPIQLEADSSILDSHSSRPRIELPEFAQAKKKLTASIPEMMTSLRELMRSLRSMKKRCRSKRRQG